METTQLTYSLRAFAPLVMKGLFLEEERIIAAYQPVFCSEET